MSRKAYVVVRVLRSLQRRCECQPAIAGLPGRRRSMLLLSSSLAATAGLCKVRLLAESAKKLPSGSGSAGSAGAGPQSETRKAEADASGGRGVGGRNPELKREYSMGSCLRTPAQGQTGGQADPRALLLRPGRLSAQLALDPGELPAPIIRLRTGFSRSGASFLPKKREKRSLTPPFH